MSPRLVTPLAGLLLATGLSAATTVVQPAAHAAGGDGTLVFVRGGDVWLAEPDGSGARRITSDGSSVPYKHPTMSDAGLVAAARGKGIVLMDPHGDKLASYTPDDLFLPSSCSNVIVSPPADPVLSPDGKHLAWSQIRTQVCGGSFEGEALTVVSAPDHLDIRALVIGSEPSWVGNRKITYIDRGGVELADAQSVDPEGYDWFTAWSLWPKDPDDIFDIDRPYLSTPAVTRDGSRVGYLVDGEPPLALESPTPDNPLSTAQPGEPGLADACGVQADAEGIDYDDFMFSPDGEAFVFNSDDEVWIMSGLDTPCDARAEAGKVLDNADDVYWSAWEPAKETRDTVRPTARISGVKVDHQRRRAVVTFAGADDRTPGSGLKFTCRLDGGAKRACRSPQAFTRLKPGRHTVKVWAKDAAGNTSRPATKAFTVRR